MYVHKQGVDETIFFNSISQGKFDFNMSIEDIKGMNDEGISESLMEYLIFLLISKQRKNVPNYLVVSPQFFKSPAKEERKALFVSANIFTKKYIIVPTRDLESKDWSLVVLENVYMNYPENVYCQHVSDYLKESSRERSCIKVILPKSREEQREKIANAIAGSLEKLLAYDQAIGTIRSNIFHMTLPCEDDSGKEILSVLLEMTSKRNVDTFLSAFESNSTVKIAIEKRYQFPKDLLSKYEAIQKANEKYSNCEFDVIMYNMQWNKGSCRYQSETKGDYSKKTCNSLMNSGNDLCFSAKRNKEGGNVLKTSGNEVSKKGLLFQSMEGSYQEQSGGFNPSATKSTVIHETITKECYKKHLKDLHQILFKSASLSSDITLRTQLQPIESREAPLLDKAKMLNLKAYHVSLDNYHLRCTCQAEKNCNHQVEEEKKPLKSQPIQVIPVMTTKLIKSPNGLQNSHSQSSLLQNLETSNEFNQSPTRDNEECYVSGSPNKREGSPKKTQSPLYSSRNYQKAPKVTHQSPRDIEVEYLFQNTSKLSASKKQPREEKQSNKRQVGVLSEEPKRKELQLKSKAVASGQFPSPQGHSANNYQSSEYSQTSSHLKLNEGSTNIIIAPKKDLNKKLNSAMLIEDNVRLTKEEMAKSQELTRPSIPLTLAKKLPAAICIQKSESKTIHSSSLQAYQSKKEEQLPDLQRQKPFHLASKPSQTPTLNQPLHKSKEQLQCDEQQREDQPEEKVTQFKSQKNLKHPTKATTTAYRPPSVKTQSISSEESSPNKESMSSHPKDINEPESHQIPAFEPKDIQVNEAENDDPDLHSKPSSKPKLNEPFKGKATEPVQLNTLSKINESPIRLKTKAQWQDLKGKKPKTNQRYEIDSTTDNYDLTPTGSILVSTNDNPTKESTPLNEAADGDKPQLALKEISCNPPSNQEPTEPLLNSIEKKKKGILLNVKTVVCENKKVINKEIPLTVKTVVRENKKVINDDSSLIDSTPSGSNSIKDYPRVVQEIDHEKDELKTIEKCSSQLQSQVNPVNSDNVNKPESFNTQITSLPQYDNKKISPTTPDQEGISTAKNDYHCSLLSASENPDEFFGNTVSNKATSTIKEKDKKNTQEIKETNHEQFEPNERITAQKVFSSKDEDSSLPQETPQSFDNTEDSFNDLLQEREQDPTQSEKPKKKKSNAAKPNTVSQMPIQVQSEKEESASQYPSLKKKTINVEIKRKCDEIGASNIAKPNITIAKREIKDKETISNPVSLRLNKSKTLEPSGRTRKKDDEILLKKQSLEPQDQEEKHDGFVVDALHTNWSQIEEITKPLITSMGEPTLEQEHPRNTSERRKLQVQRRQEEIINTLEESTLIKPKIIKSKELITQYSIDNINKQIQQYNSMKNINLRRTADSDLIYDNSSHIEESPSLDEDNFPHQTKENRSNSNSFMKVKAITNRHKRQAGITENPIKVTDALSESSSRGLETDIIDDYKYITKQIREQKINIQREEIIIPMKKGKWFRTEDFDLQREYLTCNQGYRNTLPSKPSNSLSKSLGSKYINGSRILKEMIPRKTAVAMVNLPSSINEDNEESFGAYINKKTNEQTAKDSNEQGNVCGEKATVECSNCGGKANGECIIV